MEARADFFAQVGLGAATEHHLSSCKRGSGAKREAAQEFFRWLSSKLPQAGQLQAQEDKAGTKANSRKEKKAMAKSTDGKSVLAVQQIIALVKTANLPETDPGPNPDL